MKIKSLSQRSLAVVLTTILLLVAIPATAVFAVSSGPNNAGAGASTGSSGTSWTNPGNITAVGSPYATASLGFYASSRYLQGTSYGFSIPTNATIDTITVVINRQSSGNSVTDSNVRLLKAGVLTGNNLASGTSWPNGSFGTATYGGAIALWGGTWTPADINDTNFGVSLSASNGTYSSRTLSVDYMQITVTYTLPVTTTTVGDGITPPANKFVEGSDTNKAVSAFTLATSTGTDTVTALTVTGSGTGLANVAASGVKLWKDNGTIGEWDGADTAVGTGVTFSGNAASFSGLSIPVTTTATQYLVTYNIVASPTNAQTMLGAVTSVTATNAVINNDNTDATLTVDATAPAFSAVLPVAGASINSITTASDVSYTLSKALVSGSIVMTRTGGTADASSPHTCTLTAAAMTSGAHNNLNMTAASGCTATQSLVDGAIYTFDFNGVGAGGLAAVPVSNTGVTFDTTAPAFSAVLPAASATINSITTNSDVSYTLSETIASGTIVMTRTGGATDGTTHTCTLLAPARIAGPHSNLDLSNTTNGCQFAQSLVDGTTYTFAFNGTDLAGNAAVPVSSTVVTFDTAAPTNQDTVFAASAFKKGGTSVMIVSSGTDSNSVWFAPAGTTNFVAGPNMTTAASGTATTILAPATAGAYKLFVLDAAGNISAASTATLTVDNTAPTISIGTPSLSTTTSGPVTYTVTYADTNFNSSTLAVGNITLNGSATGTVTVTGTGLTRTVTISAISGSGTLGISIAAGTASDLAGNLALTAGPSSTFSVVLPGPTATTTGATAVSATGATLNGMVNANSASTTVTFQYGTTTSYGTTVTATQSPVTGAANTDVSVAISGLSSGTLYHYRVVATNANGTTNSADATFQYIIGTTYYVDNTHVSPACSDGGAGTLAQPFCTIGKGRDMANSAGKTVRVLAGTYAETVTANYSGTAGSPITFSAAPGVTVTGAAGNGFTVSSKSYIVIDGFNVTGTDGIGIFINSSNHITISNNIVSLSGSPVDGSTRHGIQFSGTTYSTISGNTAHHNSSHGIYLSAGSNNNTVSNNTSYANANMWQRSANGISVDLSSNNTIIHNFTYANEDSGIQFYHSSSYNRVIGNVSYGNADHGIDFNASPYNTVIGNTVHGNVTAGINFEGDPVGSDGATVINNIMFDNGVLLLAGGGTASGAVSNLRFDTRSFAGNTLDYNLYYLDSGTIQIIDWNGVKYATLADFQAAVPGQELHGLETDPLFVAPAPIAIRPSNTVGGLPALNVGNYYITAGSPAIDSANSDAPYEPFTDIGGNARVDDLSILDSGVGARTFDDRGAYEFLPSGELLSAVTTQAMDAITTTTATGHGTITFLGVPDPINYGVVWGTTINPTVALTTKTAQGAIHVTGAFTSDITGLTPGTLYHLRAYATNSAGTSYGGDVTFTALQVTTVTTQTVTDIGTTTAAGNGTITSLGVPNVTQYGVVWSTGSNPDISLTTKTEQGIPSGTGTFTSNITGLTPNTTYYVRAYATNAVTTSYGGEVTFTTYLAPTVTTQTVDAIMTTTAVGHGNITLLGVPAPTQHGVVWDTASDPTITLLTKTQQGTAGAGTFTSTITGLTPGTTYHVRAYATNLAGTFYGADVIFTALQVPTVTTEAVTGIGINTATGNGNISSLGVPNPTEYGVVWGTAVNPDVSLTTRTEQGNRTGTGAFTSNITGLAPNTLYHVRAYATNTAGTSYGTDVTFTTLPLAPTVTTQAVTAIGTNTATGNGNITSLGVPNPTQYGVVWDIASNPTTALPTKTTEDVPTGTGAFTSGITGLSPNTLYYVRAYVTNTAGTVYGDEVTFTTLLLPTVTTQDVTDITTATAIGNGNITNLGVPDATVYGVVWNTAVDPTTELTTKTEQFSPSSTGAFTSSITGLTPGMLYHVRAYATNVAGTSYGGDVTFTAHLAPTVTTQAVTSIGAATATGNGTVTVLGVPDPTNYGVVWGTAINPTVALPTKTEQGDRTGTGAFTSDITGLTPGTLYYVRAYATNAVDTVYGTEVSFTTLPSSTGTTTPATNAGAGANVTGIGTGAWLNPGNIIADDTSYANVTLAASTTSNYLEGTNYGFAIPSNATINGIVVTIGRFGSGTPGLRDNVVSLIKGGTITSTNKAATTDWPDWLVPANPVPTATYGSSADLWGTTTWTPADINAGNFGVALSAINTSTFTRTANVDYMQISVTYTVTVVGSSTTVDCGAGTPTGTYGTAITCVATVVRGSSGNTPTGNVSWTTNGSGNFVTSPCALSGSGGTATCSVAYTPTGTGSHLITANYAGDLNFYTSTGNQTVTVNKKTASVTPNVTGKIFGESDPILAGSLVGFLPADGVTAAYNRVAGETVALSPYTISAVLSPVDVLVNYNITYNTAAFAITAKPITITPTDGLSKVYGTVADPTFTYTFAPALETGDSFSGTLSRAAGTDVANYAYTPGNLSAGSNYSLSLASGHTFAITAKPITVTADAGQSKVYGTSDPTFTYTSSDSAATFTGALTRVAGTNVGAYAIEQGSLAVVGSNYSMSFVSKDFTITAKPITVTADTGQSKVFGAVEPTFTYTSSDSAATFTGALDRVAGTNVGAYAIEQGSLAVVGSNYSMSFVSKDFTITAKPITVTADAGQSKVYGTSDPTFTYTSSDFAATFTGALDRVAGTNVGAYAIEQGSLAVVGSNYSMSFVSKDFTIIAKPITVTADTGQSKVFGEVDPTFTYTSSDSAATFTGALDRVAGTNVGAYAIEQGSLAVVGSNYSMSFVSKDFTIIAKPITVTADTGQSKVFGEVDPTFTYTSSDSAATFTGALDRVAGTNVGAYAIEQGSLAVVDSNYSMSFVSKDFTIIAKPITVTADTGQSKVFGEVDPTFTYTSSDSAATFTGALTRVAGTNVGAYAIEQGSLAVVGSNYSMSFVSKDFTITAKPITVTADAGQSKVFGAVDPTFTYTSSDSAATFTGALDRVAGTNVGDYAIGRGTLSAGTNYTITFVSKDFSITAKPITVTADAGQSKVYGTVADPIFTYTSSDFAATFTGALDRVAGEDVGTYAIEQGSLAVVGSNYSMSFVSKDFTITAKPITVTADAGQSKVFGAVDPTFTYTSSDSAATFTGALDRVAGTNVGDYAIGRGTLSAGTNYTITFVSKDFSITAKPITVTADAGQSKVYGTVADPIFTYTSSDFAATFTGALDRVAGEDVGTYAIGQGTLAVVGSNYSMSFVSKDFSITPASVTHSIPLVVGWNLISFNVHPDNTDITAVLSSIDTKYDLVYAWDATGDHAGAGNWMRFAPGIPGNTLATLDESQGFWIRMKDTGTLVITGTVPTTTYINLLTTASGWNLVGYPSIVDRSMPSALASHGVTGYSLMYAYHADETDTWKRYAPDVPGNDLLEVTPGWAYWIKVTETSSWDVER